jgi:hypothetical protein
VVERETIILCLNKENTSLIQEKNKPREWEYLQWHKRGKG